MPEKIRRNKKKVAYLWPLFKDYLVLKLLPENTFQMSKAVILFLEEKGGLRYDRIIIDFNHDLQNSENLKTAKPAIL